MSLTFAKQTGYIRTGELETIWKNITGCSRKARRTWMRKLMRERSGGTRGKQNLRNRLDRVTHPRIF